MGIAANPAAWWRAKDIATDGTTNPGQAVALWPDASGNGHNLSNPAAGQRPALAFGSNGIRGMVAAAFDGIDDNLIDSLADPRSVASYEVFVVARDTFSPGAISRATLIGSSTFGASEPGLGYNGSSTDFAIAHGGGSIASFVVPDPAEQPILVAQRFTNPGSALRINGVSYGTQGAPTVPGSAPNTLVLGAFPPISFYWRGLIGEALIYPRLLSADERFATEQYLNLEWGLGLPGLGVSPERPFRTNVSRQTAGTALGRATAATALTKRSTGLAVSRMSTQTKIEETDNG